MKVDGVLEKAVQLDNAIDERVIALLPQYAATAIVELKRSVRAYKESLNLIGRINQNKELERVAEPISLKELPIEKATFQAVTIRAVTTHRINNHSEDCGCEQCEF